MNHAVAAFTPLVSWQEFQLLPDLDNGEHYELHDGQAVAVPFATPRRVAFRGQLARVLRAAEEFDFVSSEAFWYRPAVNCQFWRADVAVFPRAVMREMRDWDDWAVYAPPLIAEVLSRSDPNTPEKMNRQRIVAISGGTREFWVVNTETQTVHVTTAVGVQVYGLGELVPCSLSPRKYVAVDGIFNG
jgi:Uma2 family endonuclease